MKKENFFKKIFSVDSYKRAAKEYAIQHGYKGIKYIGNWEEYRVYEPYMNHNQVSFIGLPLVILANEQGDIRMSTAEEAHKIIEDNNFMQNYEENKNKEELNKLLNEMDNKIKEMEKGNNIPKESDLVETEISKKLEEKLTDISHFSILNKAVEELYLAKKKYMNDFCYLLINQTDNKWLANSAIYVVHLKSIMEAILRRTEDEATLKELEYLNQATELLKTQNRVILVKLVDDMMKLELNR